MKPNLFPVVVRELRQCKGPANQLVLSIMSGITITEIEQVLLYIPKYYQTPVSHTFHYVKGLFQKVVNLKAIIRVMPNTPALVGAGCAGNFYILNLHTCL